MRACKAGEGRDGSGNALQYCLNLGSHLRGIVWLVHKEAKALAFHIFEFAGFDAAYSFFKAYFPAASLLIACGGYYRRRDAMQQPCSPCSSCFSH